MTGWIKISREMRDHPYVGIKHPQRFAAWFWMLSEACWKDTPAEIGGKPVLLKRGQFSHSLRFISDKTGMTFQQVRTFLDGLESRGMLSKSNTAGNNAQSVITICNYSTYQDVDGANGKPDNTAITQQQHSDNTKNKKVRKEEGKKKDIGVSFSAFWDLWGSLGGKVNRSNAETAWARLSCEDREKAYSAAPSWFPAWRKANPSASPIHASTYLNKRRFEDEAPKGIPNERPRTAQERAAANDTAKVDAWLDAGRQHDEEQGHRTGEGDPGFTSERGMDCGAHGDPVVTLFPTGSGRESFSGGGTGLDFHSQQISAMRGR